MSVRFRTAYYDEETGTYGVRDLTAEEVFDMFVAMEKSASVPLSERVDRMAARILNWPHDA